MKVFFKKHESLKNMKVFKKIMKVLKQKHESIKTKS